MQHIATLWKQEYYDKERDMMPRACICYPGSEIILNFVIKRCFTIPNHWFLRLFTHILFSEYVIPCFQVYNEDRYSYVSQHEHLSIPLSREPVADLSAHKQREFVTNYTTGLLLLVLGLGLAA
ncbi:hypothetical protein Q3G72_011900 [Acer saccharum]|nr:hypothetical protein Q3G72_011900 [Acer saccharum]